MHERGTYGRCALSTYNHETVSPQAWNARSPRLGAEIDLKHAAMSAGADVGLQVLFTMVGVVLGRSATPKDPLKGTAIGGMAGYFAALLTGQKVALDRIADRIA